MALHPSVEKAFNEIDAAIFSGDEFFNEEDLSRLKNMLSRWTRQLSYLEDMANLPDDDAKNEKRPDE